jgi:hypothetical protein
MEELRRLLFSGNNIRSVRCVFGFGGGISLAAPGRHMPDIVLLLADDVRHSDLGYNGSDGCIVSRSTRALAFN